MQQVLVAVLVALALLQQVHPQDGAEEAENNHSNSELGTLLTVLHASRIFMSVYIIGCV